MKTTHASVALVLTLTIAASCGGGSSAVLGPADGSSLEVGADAGVSADRWPGTCDPVAQDCPAGQQCTGGCNVQGVMSKVFTCAVPAAGAVATNGQDCGNGCARGHDCYTVATDGGTRSVCRKYCNSDTECPSGRCVAEGLVCNAGDMNPIGRLCGL
jgi:hypothetical protein